MVTAPFSTTLINLDIADRTWRLRVLSDRQQYHDPDGAHEAAGVIPAHWSLFGVTWDAGLVLARLMIEEPIDGRRILELGAGLGLPSLVLHARGADVTPTDVHPMAAKFFADNLKLNGLPDLEFRHADWRETCENLPRFDLIVASDVLYDPSDVAPLATFLQHHCKESGSILMTDPGRKHMGRFNRRMTEAGFTVTPLGNDDSIRTCRYDRRPLPVG